jgi:glycosyltransferase involved in cell wall biosynthesis
MLLDLRGAPARRNDLALEAADAVRALEALAHPRPILLACYPPGPSPYYSLLYSRALESGIIPIEVRAMADAAALVRIASIAGARVVLHLHWLAAVLRGAADETDAAHLVADCAAQLDRLRDGGVSIAWTVHNVLPHDARLPAAEAALRREVVARASVVHVMSEATLDLLADQLVVPEGLLLKVPHPALTGLYPDWIDGLEARRLLRLSPDTPAVGLLGSLHPYKGLDELLDALPAAARRRPGIRLVVGGSVGQGDRMRAVVDRALDDPRVAIHPRRVPDDLVQYLMRGVDAVVLPYRRVLNSAALMVALAFDRPVVFPDDPALREFADPAIAVTYERGSPDALAEAIDRALALPREGVIATARRFCAERDPATLSRAFAGGLRRLLEVT